MKKVIVMFLLIFFGTTLFGSTLYAEKCNIKVSGLRYYKFSKKQIRKFLRKENFHVGKIFILPTVDFIDIESNGEDCAEIAKSLERMGYKKPFCHGSEHMRSQQLRLE